MIKNFVRLSAIIALGTILVATTPNALAQARVFDGSNAGTATSTAAAATLNTQSGTITTEALTTAAQASYSFVLTNSKITVNSVIVFNVEKGTATTGGLVPAYIGLTAGVATVIFQNPGSAAVNGTVKIHYVIIAGAK